MPLARRPHHYLRDFWTFVKPYRKPLREVYLLYFLNSVLNLLPPLSVRYYIDLLFHNAAVTVCGITLPSLAQRSLSAKLLFTAVFVGTMIALIIVANTIGVIMWRRGTRSVERMVMDIKLKIHHHINKLSLGYFNSERIGTIMTKAVGDVQNISQLLRNSFNLTYAVIQFLLAPILIAMLSPLLLVIVLIPAPLIGYAFYAMRTRLRPMYRVQREHESAIASQIQEVISGIREIKAFNMEERSHSQYRDINRRYYRMQNEIMRVFSFNHQLQYGARDLGVILVAALGGVCALLDWSNITVGKITACIALSSYLYNPISQFLSFYDTVQRGMVSLERVIDFLNEEPDVRDDRHALTLDVRATRGAVSFRDVSFSYDGRSLVLKNITFDVAPGERIAIVGPSGSGKSTLISLLLRFYDVSTGQILLDGRDIRTFTQVSLRMAAGIVFQETFLFYGTIRDNLLFVNPTKTEADMYEACKAANIHDFILTLPRRYDTVVGERGVTLSGGQKQRLALARVFLKDPPIVILDEATSAVDTKTEQLIQEGIERMLKNRTAFIIAHRLSTIKHCDRIIVLSHGTLAEMGTHDQLYAQRGIYFDLCEHNKL
ncbi:MAG: ABC transporter ATP-binding protein/permease [bacterium]|nr:ABC transporter ATP-binding protein/permease [bacterium]